MCRNGALSELCDFLDFGRCVEFILKLKDGSKQDLREYRILSLVHPTTTDVIQNIINLNTAQAQAITPAE